MQMTIRRTFIELVAMTPGGSRVRALTDSALEEKRADFSDASTDAPSDHDDATDERAAAVQRDGVGPFGIPTPMLEAGWAAPHPWASNADIMQMWWMMDGGMVDGGAVAATWPWPGQHLSSCAETEILGYAPSATAACSSTAAETPSTNTTVMLRNIPSGYTRSCLLELLEDEGLAGSFDFVYLPMDFGSQCCLGYAFVNFLSNADAMRCWRIFEGFNDWGRPSEKVCEVSWSDPQQGLSANIERYRNSPVMHSIVPEEWKPVVFQSGARVPFPATTKPIKAPKLRCRPNTCGATK